jgi:F-type H+-transporting ATPase subunit a
MIFIFAISLLIRVSIKLRPGKIQNIAETVVVFLLSYIDRITRDRKKSWELLPFVGGVFFFILIVNWLGLIPGVGSFGLWMMEEGHRVFIPAIRAGSADLNLTIALAALTVISSHAMAIWKLGPMQHIGKFIQFQGIWAALKTFNFIKIFTAFIHAMVGLFELIGEAAKVASLSLRLFGNVFAGEVLLTVMASLISVFLPAPFLLLEFGVGFVQALVFALLSCVYLHVMMSAPHEAHESEEKQRRLVKAHG